MIPNGALLMPWVNSVTTPVGVMRPIRAAVSVLSVNQRLPSGPLVICHGAAPGSNPAANTDSSVPEVVIRPIACDSVNQMFPSGPAVIHHGPCPGSATWNSVTTPCGVILPILPVLLSANHKLPSGPLVIPSGPLFGVIPCEKSVTTP